MRSKAVPILLAVLASVACIGPAASQVTSFATRTGAVTPQSGDYSAVTETLTNKTINGATINGATITGTMTTGPSTIDGATITGSSTINEAQIVLWQRDNPTSSPYPAVGTELACGHVVSAEGVSGALTVRGPSSPATDCAIALYANLTGNDIFFDPNNANNTNTLNYIKSDDFDRIATPVWIPYDGGHKALLLRYVNHGIGYQSFDSPLTSSVVKRNLHNGGVLLSHDDANSRLQLCPVTDGGLVINRLMTYVPVTCEFLLDSTIGSAGSTYYVYASRSTDTGVTGTSAGGGGNASCPDSGALCLAFGSSVNFQSGDAITCVNFFVSAADVYDDPHTVFSSSDPTHIELSDVTYAGAEGNYSGVMGGPPATTECAFTSLRSSTTAPALDSVMGIQVNPSLSWQTLVGTVTLNGGGNVSQVVSQYNGYTPAVLAATPVASLPAVIKTGLQQASDEGGGPAIVFGDQSNWRRIGDGQVATANVGSRGLLARFNNRASDQLRGEIEQVYQKLKDNSLLVSGTCTAHCLTGLWVFALPNQNDTLLNWVKPGTCTITVVGSPTFTANRGYTGVSGALLDTGCKEADLGGSQDDFAVGAYVYAASASAAAVIGQNAPGTGRRMYLQSATSGVLTVRLNDATSDNYTPARYTGMFSLLRDPAATGTISASIDETSTGIARASQANAVNSIAFLGTNDATGAEYSTAAVSFAFAGHLTTADLAELRAILSDYFLVQVGARTATVANLPPAVGFKGQTYYIPDLGGGAGLLQSDGTNWFRTGETGYQTQGDADKAAFYLTDAGSINVTATLSANRTVTLSDTDAKGTTVKTGARFRITRTGLGAFTETVKDGGGSTLKTIASGTAGWVDAIFDGSAWQLAADGTL